MPVILAIWEVRSQPGEIVYETQSQKNPSQKKAGGVAQGVGPEFKLQYHIKSEKQKTLLIFMWNSTPPIQKVHLQKEIRNQLGAFFLPALSPERTAKKAALALNRTY
jgi:hypothetical protein